MPVSPFTPQLLPFVAMFFVMIAYVVKMVKVALGTQTIKTWNDALFAGGEIAIILADFAAARIWPVSHYPLFYAALRFMAGTTTATIGVILIQSYFPKKLMYTLVVSLSLCSLLFLISGALLVLSVFS
ncbi:MAG TPA: hypothetical protein VLI92_05305 [Candidatus Saccharimonadales bacterium]|nr:hypothetical protein [Candidatus Saccharimonadales bacterium]